MESEALLYPILPKTKETTQTQGQVTWLMDESPQKLSLKT
jgi:hypothetical protein